MEEAPPTNPYEADSLLREYLLFHFGGADDVFDGLPAPPEGVRFAQRCVTDLLLVEEKEASALDVGCAVGGSCFELAKTCPSVLGIDYSKGFINAANQLASAGEVPTTKLVEAGKMAPFTARVEHGIDRSRVRFEVGDATNLRPDFGRFDIVLAANLICRLPEPKKFLHRLPELVKPGGQLLLATPFTWLEAYTPRENWLGKSRSSFEDLTGILHPHFHLEHRVDLPFIIREHARKFQYGISLGSRWRRKSD